MRISRQDFSLVGLIVLLDLLVFASVFSGNLLDEPLVSEYGRNRDAATALSFMVISLYVVFLAIYFGYHCGAFFFLAFQSFFYLPLLFLTNYSDTLQVQFLFIHLTFFLFLNVALMLMFKSGNRRLPEPSERKSDSYTTFLINLLVAVVSLLATALYFRANGGLIYQKSGSADLIADARLSYYATGSYTYAGYANQFKNILLPMTFILLLISAPRNWRRFALVPVVIAIFLATTGTGQRAPLLFAGISLLIFFSFYYRYNVNTKTLFVFAIAIQGFGFMSFLQGRITEFSILHSFLELFQRQFLVNQTANLETYWYVVERGHRFGMDWIQDVLSLAPSIKPDNLPRELFGILWGSYDRGNSPPSLVTTLYFNFSIPGLLILPIILAYAVKAVDAQLHSKQSSKTKVMIFAFILMSLASWTSGSVLTPLNGGLLTCLFYLFLMRLKLRFRTASTARAVHRPALKGGARSASRICSAPGSTRSST